MTRARDRASGSGVFSGTVTGSVTGNVTGTVNASKLNVPSSTTEPTSPTTGDVYYNTTKKSKFIYDGTAFVTLKGFKDGSSASSAATSAKAILDIDSNAPDGDYWLKPLSNQPAFKVHCYMTIEGGGWMKLLSANTYNTSGQSFVGNQTNANFLSPGWEGWYWNDVKNYEGNFTGARGNDQFTPIYHTAPFNDVMIIAAGDYTSNRLGWRHNTQYSSVRTRIHDTNAPTFHDSVLFGSTDLLSHMRRRSDTSNHGSHSAAKLGFKIRADTGASGLTSSWFVGGTQYGGSSGHGVSMIGVGRENTNGGYFGGGFGFAYHSGYYFKFGGHWWGHGYSRNQGAWSADASSGVFDHAVYVREQP